jgi:alkylhydroperoxidase/carboxymuconolactone decarboxylase family protein YurZ
MSENTSAYGYAWTEWLAKEDPEYMKVRQPLSEYSTGDGKALSIKYREMVMIGILAFRGRSEGVVAHMRRADSRRWPDPQWRRPGDHEA